MAAYDVAVIGLGASGGAALYHLARRGRRVIGLERAEPGHEGGSSHGESRIIRMAYFEHPSYVDLVRVAYANWRALEAASGRTVITTTGILEAGIPGSVQVRDSLASAVLHDLPHEVLTGRQVRERFPAFALPDDWQAVFQPNGGILSADLAVRLHVDGARAAGAEVRTHTTVRGIEARGPAVRVVLDDGAAIEAGAVVVAAGPWIGDLIPSLSPHLSLSRQAVSWFEPSQPALTGPDRFPVFLLETDADPKTDTPADVIYGFPDFAGTGVKAASHLPGCVWANADAARQDATPDDARRVLNIFRRLIPAAAGPVKQVKTCIYSNTADTDFIIDRLPSDPRVVLASACSGHGFKFASLLGEILADLATIGATRHDISRFALARLAD